MKRRPACVVSSAEYNGGPDVIVAMVTSNQTRLQRQEIGDVVIRDWEIAGPRLPSVVRAGRPLVPEGRLLPLLLGQLSPLDLAELDQALLAVLGLAVPG